MSFLPIVERELRLAARRPWTYWMRAVVVLVAVVVSAWVFSVNSSARSMEIGRILFYVLTAGAGLFSLTAGVRSTADCLSEEKREGTLGLLFLTSLRSYDIVLGKLVANSLGAFYGVLAIIPALGIPILLGGTSAGQFVRVALVIPVVLFFSLAAGMLASSLCQSSRKARTLAFVIVFFFTAAFPGLGAWFAAGIHEWKLVEPFLLTSPVFTYVAAMDNMVLRLGDAYYWSLATLTVLGFSFLGLAAIITPRSWQDRPRVKFVPSTPGEAVMVETAKREDDSFRRRTLDVNPFFWLATKPASRALHAWGIFLVLGLGWLWGIGEAGQEWFNIGIYIATAFCLNSMLKVWLASEACRQIASDRKHGTLELLLSTSISVREIVDGQRLALQRQFGLPIATAILLELTMLVFILGDSSNGLGDRAMWIWLWVLSMVLLVVDSVALFWGGMWAGLTSRDARRAYSKVIGVVMVLPWLVCAAFLALVGIGALGATERFGWGVFAVGWFLPALAVDVVVVLIARQNLLHQFRARATERFQSR